MEGIRVNVKTFRDDMGGGRYPISDKRVYLSVRACHTSRWPSHSRGLGSLSLCGTYRGQSGIGIDISLMKHGCQFYYASHDSSKQSRYRPGAAYRVPGS
jgi:hypothetical protein